MFVFCITAIFFIFCVPVLVYVHYTKTAGIDLNEIRLDDSIFLSPKTKGFLCNKFIM